MNPFATVAFVLTAGARVGPRRQDDEKARAYPGARVLIWYGIVLPAGTPRSIVTRLHDEAVRIMALPEVRDRFVQLGVDPTTSSSDEFSRLIADELARWRKVIKTANIKVN